MKAIRVHETGGPEVLRLEEIPDLTPAAGQVVVRMHAVGVNPVDTYVRSALQGRKPVLPYTPGSDGAGVVEAIGPAVASFQEGDRVYVIGTAPGADSGTYAEQAVCAVSQVRRLPARVSFSQGAAVGVPYGTAYRALVDRAQTLPGEIVLIHGGSGGVGTAAIQLARARGLTVFATAGTERGRSLILSLGAHDAFDHTTTDYLARIKEATGQHGADVILEMLANVNLDHDLGLLAFKGRVVVVGNRGRVEIDARQAMGKDSAILGMTMMNVTPAESARIHAALGAGLSDGTLRPVVGREFALADASRAHEAVMQPGAFGKIVLIP